MERAQINALALDTALKTKLWTPFSLNAPGKPGPQSGGGGGGERTRPHRVCQPDYRLASDTGAQTSVIYLFFFPRGALSL